MCSYLDIVVFDITLLPSYAHDILADFMEGHGFVVTRHYLGLQTAWRAEFTHGKGGRTIGVNAEMDALPLIGHACGHNLIAVSGVGVAIAIKSALLAHDIVGNIVLLGTPGELKLVETDHVLRLESVQEKKGEEERLRFSTAVVITECTRASCLWHGLCGEKVADCVQRCVGVTRLPDLLIPCPPDHV